MSLFQIELLKLMARMAAVDGEVAPAEVETIIRAGRRAGVDDLLLETLRATLESGDGGAPPDLEVLRAHPDEVRRLAREVVAADGILADAEIEALRVLEEALTGDG